jgi:preprotein translocase subunit YajC
MDFFISPAMAQQAGQNGEPSMLVSLLPLIIIFVLFWFLLIRPQTKRAKEHKKKVEALKKGDEVVTSGGVLGRISDIGDNFILLDVTEGVQLKVQKQAVATLMPKGTASSKEL